MQLNFLEYLEATAVRLPEKIALTDETAEFTFSRLLHASRAIGSALLPLTKKNAPVIVFCSRTAISVAGFLGALQAGCCYVPLDAKMPAARMETILRQVRPAAVLCAQKDMKLGKELENFAPVLLLEQCQHCPEDEQGLQARRDAVLDIDPAYVIYTSGSTGTPKGILISHRAIIDFAEWLGDFSGVRENDVLANQAPFFFDLSMKDLTSCLRGGLTLHILPKKLFMFPKLLTAFLNEKGVTVLFWATSAFRMVAVSGILEKQPPLSVRKVILGGEALQSAHLRRWQEALPQTQIINLYGPTEVTVDCTCFSIERTFADDEPIPIGKACKNMEIFLLDDALRPVPHGEVGEICVRGIGLAIGYLDEPEKTNAAFIQNPLNPRYPDRLYRTGDLAKRDKDGNLLFMARKDDQIKHMGYRIELGEVETAICAIPGVQAAACLFDKENDKIVCFCQSTSTVEALVTAAKQRIPKYMTPNVWRMEQRLPANANGKIDRVKLRERYFEEN